MPWSRGRQRARQDARFAVSCTVVAVLAGHAHPQEAEGAEPAAWHVGLADVRLRLDRGDAAQARTLLTETLRAHARAPYVRAMRADLEELARRIAFAVEHPPPRPQSVVPGKLREWDPRSGRIHLVYSLEQWRQLGVTADRVAAGKRANSRRGPDLPTAAVHPVVFARPYTVSVSGRYPGDSVGLGYVRILTNLDQDGGFDVVFGAAKQQQGKSTVWIESSIGQLGAGRAELVKADSPAKPAARFRASVRIEDQTIRASFNGRLLLQASKPDGPWGQAGVEIVGQTDEIEIVLEGIANPSWIQNLIDAAQADDRRAFARSFDARRHLPAWLYEDEARSAENETTRARALPRDADVAAVEVAREVFRQLESAGANSAQATVDAAALPPLTRGFLLAVIAHHRGDVDAAASLLDEVCAGDPEVAHAFAVRGQCHTARGRHAAARDDFAAALNLQPEPSVLIAFVGAALRTRRLDEAQQAVAAARRSGVVVPQLDDMLRMVTLGPDWSRKFTWTTAHYEVASEIDPATCRITAETLEQVRGFLAADLGAIAGDQPQRAKVFLFAGKAGYDAYCQRILGGTAPHTAGVFSPVLKQLLIWNLPDRAEMWRTVRHEALHQYVDDRFGDLPLWLNEGLAENYELCANDTRSSWRAGRVTEKAHLALLRAKRPVPLGRFLRFDQRQFHADARLHYAQSWAVVRLLMHGEPEHRALWRRICAALEGAAAPASDALFAGVDLDALDRELARALEAWSR